MNLLCFINKILHKSRIKLFRNGNQTDQDNSRLALSLHIKYSLIQYCYTQTQTVIISTHHK